LRWGPYPFRFENMWMSHPSFKASLPGWWEVEVDGNWEGYRFMGRLRALKKELKMWNQEVFGDFRLRKKEILGRIKAIDDLEEEGRLEEGLKEESLALKMELADVVLKETSSWHQKVKIKWAKDGDNNSAFFHRWANGRKSKNFIDSLENENGEKLKGEKKIEEEILSFFSNLCGPLVESKPFVEGLDWRPISVSEKMELDSPFTLEEVRKVVFECDRNKSLGPDGFSLGFFQENWEVINSKLLEVFRKFYDRGILDSSLNETFVCLIPILLRYINATNGGLREELK
ncbi:MAG: hypothetical protein Q8761_02940, partial [Sweet potato little leaf phytoplasma]|nr:hypothetical protein [Sweet potato little leaf phytoplasma]